MVWKMLIAGLLALNGLGFLYMAGRGGFIAHYTRGTCFWGAVVYGVELAIVLAAWEVEG